MLRAIIYWVGVITTAVLGMLVFFSTIGWGKAAWDHRKQKKAGNPQPERKGFFRRKEQSA